MEKPSPTNWNEWLDVSNRRIVGKLGGKSKNKFQWRHLTLQDGKCTYALPTKDGGQGEIRGDFSLESARVKRVDPNNWPEQYKKLSGYKFESDHPVKDHKDLLKDKKCFVYVNTLAGKQIVFCVSPDLADDWMALFQLHQFPTNEKEKYSPTKATPTSPMNKALDIPRDESLAHTDALFSPRAQMEARNPDSGGKRGFEKLVEVGFSQEDIDKVRNNYYANYPNNKELPTDKRMTAEEAFIESDCAMISSSSGS